MPSVLPWFISLINTSNVFLNWFLLNVFKSPSLKLMIFSLLSLFFISFLVTGRVISCLDACFLQNTHVLQSPGLCCEGFIWCEAFCLWRNEWGFPSMRDKLGSTKLFVDLVGLWITNCGLSVAVKFCSDDWILSGLINACYLCLIADFGFSFLISFWFTMLFLWVVASKGRFVIDDPLVYILVGFAVVISFLRI